MAAFRETDSRAERSAKAAYSLASSSTNCLPMFPCGTRKIFLFQCTTISNDSFSSLVNELASFLPHVKLGSAIDRTDLSGRGS